MFLLFIVFIIVAFTIVLRAKHNGAACQCEKCKEYRSANPTRFNVHH